MELSSPLNVGTQPPIAQIAPDNRRMILVEDDDAVRRSLQLLLRWRGYHVRSYPYVSLMLDDPQVAHAHFLVADHRLPGIDGITLLAELRRRAWQGRAVLITGFPSFRLSERAHAVGFSAVLGKPLDQRRLLAALEN